MPERVIAKRIAAGDNVMASLIYPDGPEVRIQGGWFGPDTAFSMAFQVRAEQGEIELGPNGLRINDSDGNQTTPQIQQTNGYEQEVAYFLECCRDGVEPLRCLPVESARAVKVALATKESRNKNGEPIECLT
jgi:hypothetical protein